MSNITLNRMTGKETQDRTNYYNVDVDLVVKEALWHKDPSYLLFLAGQPTDAKRARILLIDRFTGVRADYALIRITGEDSVCIRYTFTYRAQAKNPAGQWQVLLTLPADAFCLKCLRGDGAAEPALANREYFHNRHSNVAA